MKIIYGTFLAFFSFQVAKATEVVTECEKLDIEQQSPKTQNLNLFSEKCRDEWKNNADYIVKKESFSIHAKKHSVLVVNSNNESHFLTGLTTGIGQINGVDISQKRNEYFVLDGKIGLISVFSPEQKGSMSPIRVIQDLRLVGANSLLIQDETNQLIIANALRKEMLVFNLNGHTHTDEAANKAKVIGAIFDASKGITPQSLVMEKISPDVAIIGVLDAASKGIVMLKSDLNTGKFKLLNSLSLSSKGVPLETVDAGTRLVSKDGVLHLEINGKEHSLGGMKLSDIVQFH